MTDTQIEVPQVKVPDWSLVTPELTPFTDDAGTWHYSRLLKSALWYVHYEVPNKTLVREFFKYCEFNFDWDDAQLIKQLPDYEFTVIGKYTYIIARGGELDDTLLARIKEYYDAAVVKAKALSNNT